MAKRGVWFGFGAVAVALSGCAAPAPQTAGGMLTLMQGPPVAQGLIGSTPEILNAEFGQPALRRVDGPAQVWLYHSSVCGLNLILYPDATGTPRVATAVPDNNDPQSCLHSLQRSVLSAALEHPSSS
jgi:hypothetical protein